MSGLFKNLITFPADPIFGLEQAYLEDSRESKINLTAGVYLSSSLEPYILRCVKEAERNLVEIEKSKNYLPIEGDLEYLQNCKKLIFSEDSPNFIAVQTVGGTGALAVGARLLKAAGKGIVGISDPSWTNHRAIFEAAGLSIQDYAYYNLKKRDLDFEQLIASLEHLPKGSVLLLQPSCHNPTGNDLNSSEWIVLIEKIIERDFYPFFDCAYQGFGWGINEDVAPIRMMRDRGRSFFIAVSHSKNFGLYCERVGALLVFDPDLKSHFAISSNLKKIIRSFHSNCPAHGSRIINTIMGETQSRAEWEKELGEMRARIQNMRALLCDALDQEFQLNNHQFSFIRKQVGMFSYTGLEKKQVISLREEHALFMPTSGRINVAGLNHESIPRVARLFVEVTQ